MYLWIVIAGAVNSFLNACGIGSNDLANSFGTIYGSKVLTVNQIVVLASICELSGSILLGSSVSSTLAGNIVDVKIFALEPYILMYGMLCALASSAIWLYLATYLYLPVSTTHSIVGGILGFSIVYKNVDAISWYKSTDVFPYFTGIFPIII